MCLQIHCDLPHDQRLSRHLCHNNTPVAYRSSVQPCRYRRRRRRRHFPERVIVDRCRTAATTPVEGVNLVARSDVDSGMFLPAPRCVATTVHADQRRPVRRVSRRSGESFDANAVDVILIVIDTWHSSNGVHAHVRSFSAWRTFWTADSKLKGGNGGRLLDMGGLLSWQFRRRLAPERVRHPQNGLKTTLLTRCGSRVGQNAVTHNTAFPWGGGRVGPGDQAFRLLRFSAAAEGLI